MGDIIELHTRVLTLEQQMQALINLLAEKGLIKQQEEKIATEEAR